MTALRQLQLQLQAHLLHDDLAIMHKVTQPKNDTSEVRLSIYSNAYHFRLLEALSKEYAVLHQWLGDETFWDIGYAYIEDYPSTYFSIDRFTYQLGKFLATTEPYKQQLYLSEIAYFINALSETVTVADAPVLSSDDIASIPADAWPQMCLTFHPSVKLFTQQWNSVAIWQALVDNKTPPEPVLLQKPSYWVVWRNGIQSFYTTLSEPEVKILKCLQQGLPFAATCEALVQWFQQEEIAQFTVNVLARWLKDGMLSEVKII